MYVLSWPTVSVLTWVLFWCLFPSLLRNSGNKHQHDTLVSAETVCHSSTYVILYSLYLLHSLQATAAVMPTPNPVRPTTRAIPTISSIPCWAVWMIPTLDCLGKCAAAGFKSLWLSDTIWWHRYWSTLAQVMACCLMGPKPLSEPMLITFCGIHLYVPFI